MIAMLYMEFFIDTCSPVIISENINKNRSVPV